MLKNPIPKVDQIGVIVKDMDKAVKYYESMGIGPFHPLRSVEITERMVRGKPAVGIKNEAMMVRIGSLALELISPIEGNSVQMEFLKSKGEGINHIGCTVDNLEEAVAEMKRRGFEILTYSKFKGGGGAVYFDTTKIGGFIIELVQWPPGFSVD